MNHKKKGGDMLKENKFLFLGMIIIGAALAIFSIYNDIVLLYGLGVLLVGLALKLTEPEANTTTTNSK